MTTRPKRSSRPFGSETPTLPEIRLPSVPPPPSAESREPLAEEPASEPTTGLHLTLPPLREAARPQPGEPRED